MLKRILRNVIAEPLAPGSLALASYALFLAGWLFPPQIYSGYMDEPDLMFFDIRSFILCSLCVTFFLIGLGIVQHIQSANSPVTHAIKPLVSGKFFLLLPLLFGIALCITSCVLIVREFPGIILLVWNQGGGEIKDLEQATGQHLPLGMANTWLLGITWWASLRLDRIGLSVTARRLILVVIGLGTLLCILDGVLQVSRMAVMLPITGAIVTYVIRRARRTGAKMSRSTIQMIVFGALGVGIFLLLSFIRGEDSSRFIEQLVGYTLSSFNRLAAIVNGSLTYQYSGRGIYLVSLLAFNHTINAIIPIARWMSWPSYLEWWQSEFVSVGAAGLNPAYIWSSAFGYIFSELGWLTPMWFLLYGVLAGTLWRSAKKGNILGAVLYPFMSFCILFWFGMNLLAEDSQVLVFVMEVVLLNLYERMLSKRYPVPVKNVRMQHLAVG